ncbi:DUF2750 domain-containing protein [Sphingobacterium siyangense]|uniref:DUF2750 domain-containing protein n=1 Tax=Sphingobacterium siyangense TaxID=459529 RepID=UPI00196619D0|nr:DUF2750 domain-containing protein [Sphingobacterium siyangense]QRY58012.1 DUF2750 domain-containing protein [Sphingobacterium siyangense]
MKITDKEIQAVTKLAPFDRYKYFLKRVADTERMYTLVNGNNEYALSEVKGNYVFSLWPFREYALLSIVGEWDNYQVKEITLDEFENEVIDFIEENKYLINVFTVDSKAGFIVNLIEFARDLSDELKKY